MNGLEIANVATEVVIAILAAAANVIVLYTLWANKSLQTVTNVLIGGLALADACVGFVGIPCVIVTLFGLPRNFHACLLLNCMIIILTQVSIFSLLAVAVERFIAIKFPFWYHKNFTVSKALIVSSFNWMLGTVVGLTPMGWNLGWKDDADCGFVQVIDFRYRVYFNYLGFILTPLVIMALIYVYIFTIVKAQIRDIASLQVNSASSDQTSVRRELKAAKKFALVIGLFALCWVPLETLNAITLWTGFVHLPAVLVCVWLSHFNSALNPLLYAYGNSALRKAIKTALLCKRNRIEDSHSATHTQSSVP